MPNLILRQSSFRNAEYLQSAVDAAGLCIDLVEQFAVGEFRYPHSMPDFLPYPCFPYKVDTVGRMVIGLMEIQGE